MVLGQKQLDKACIHRYLLVPSAAMPEKTPVTRMTLLVRLFTLNCDGVKPVGLR
jgi:hypothetical protein